MPGQTVMYVLPNGQARPAIVVQQCGEVITMQVFTNGGSDLDSLADIFSGIAGRQESVLLRGATHDSDGEKPGTWHWPFWSENR